ncbi:MAG: hypothetical protein IT384_25280 [Deltaproteobacteria bacterium]|nr:hypothetical protein [Deltaproteobacteria bacterium]
MRDRYSPALHGRGRGRRGGFVVLALWLGAVSLAGEARAQEAGSSSVATSSAAAAPSAAPAALVTPAKVEPTRQPEPSTAPAGAGPSNGRSGGTVSRVLSGAQVGGTADDTRKVHFAALAQLRMLAVTDTDPANDIGVIWSGEVAVEVFKSGIAFGRLGVLQSFVSSIDHPAFQFQDIQVGMSYHHALPAAALGLEDREVELTYYGSIYIPTSLASSRQTMILTPELRGRADLMVVDDLTLSLDLRFQYRFHEFAERLGPGAPMNTQLVLAGTLGAAYDLYKDEKIGAISVGVDLLTGLAKRYPSRESFESDASSQSFWNQSFGWDVYVSYAPLSYLQAAISVEQNGPVLRSGIVNTFFTKLEETELVFTLSARY